MKLRVTILSHYASSVESFRGSLISALVYNGCDVCVLAPDWSLANRTAVKALGAETETFPLSRVGLNVLHDLSTLRWLIRHFCQTKPHIVFSYSVKPNVWGMVAAWLTKVPRRVAMVEGLGYAFTPDAKSRQEIKKEVFKFLISFLYRLAFWCATRIVVLNPDDARELKNTCDLSLNKTLILGGIGVPLDIYLMQPPHFKPFTFTFIGRFLKEKGLQEVVQAAREIKAKYPNVRTVILGDVDTNPGAIPASKVNEWVENGWVEWPGQVDVRPWLANTSVFVLPSYREGVPRSTQEAAAMGRPVITTDVPGCRETVVDGRNGFLIPPQNIEALIAAMEKFIADPEMLIRMGIESRKLAEERFNVHTQNLKLLQIMEIA